MDCMADILIMWTRYGLYGRDLTANLTLVGL